MKFIESMFFGETYCHVRVVDNQYWPVTVRITNDIDFAYDAGLVFHMTIPQLIAFKNSVIGAYESAMEKTNEKESSG